MQNNSANPDNGGTATSITLDPGVLLDEDLVSVPSTEDQDDDPQHPSDEIEEDEEDDEGDGQGDNPRAKTQTASDGDEEDEDPEDDPDENDGKNGEPAADKPEREPADIINEALSEYADADEKRRSQIQNGLVKLASNLKQKAEGFQQEAKSFQAISYHLLGKGVKEAQAALLDMAKQAAQHHGVEVTEIYEAAASEIPTPPDELAEVMDVMTDTERAEVEKLLRHNQTLSSEIEALKGELEGIRKEKEAEAALSKAWTEVRTSLRRSLGDDFKVTKDEFNEAVKAYPGIDPLKAVRVHLEDRIVAHRAKQSKMKVTKATMPNQRPSGTNKGLGITLLKPGELLDLD